jgi:hypothetical protein
LSFHSLLYFVVFFLFHSPSPFSIFIVFFLYLIPPFLYPLFLISAEDYNPVVQSVQSNFCSHRNSTVISDSKPEVGECFAFCFCRSEGKVRGFLKCFLQCPSSELRMGRSCALKLYSQNPTWNVRYSTPHAAIARLKCYVAINVPFFSSSGRCGSYLRDEISWWKKIFP